MHHSALKEIAAPEMTFSQTHKRKPPPNTYPYNMVEAAHGSIGEGQ